MALNIASGALLAATSLVTTHLATAAPTSASVDDVDAKIKDITSQITALHATIKTFASQGKAGTLPEVLTFYSNCYGLIATIDSTTNIVKVVTPSPVPDSAAEGIYNQLRAIEPLIVTGLAELQVKKSAFIALMPQLLKVLGDPTVVIHAGLVALQKSFTGLRISLIVACPIAIKFQAKDLGQRVYMEIAVLFYQP